MSKLTSEIWSYFTINDADESKPNCNICNRKLSWDGQKARSYGLSLRTYQSSLACASLSVSGIFKSISNEIHNKINKCKKEDECSSESTKQRNIDVFVKKLKPFGQNSNRQHSIMRAITRMIATNLQPLRVYSTLPLVLCSWKGL